MLLPSKDLRCRNPGSLIISPHFSQDFSCGDLTRTSHQLSTATADPGMSTVLRSLGLLDVLKVRLRGPRSRALYPRPSTPPRDETW
jgi:hypothetical protein